MSRSDVYIIVTLQTLPLGYSLTDSTLPQSCKRKENIKLKLVQIFNEQEQIAPCDRPYCHPAGLWCPGWGSARWRQTFWSLSRTSAWAARGKREPGGHIKPHIRKYSNSFLLILMWNLWLISITSTNLRPEWRKEDSSRVWTLATLMDDAEERGIGELTGERASGEEGEGVRAGGKSW